MLCIYCKGPHASTSCALFKNSLRAMAKTAVGKEFSGEAPTPFVGHANYPNVSLGLLSVPFEKNTQHYDAPGLWARQRASIDHVAELRRSMLNARQQANVMTLTTRHIENAQQIAMASRPVDVDVTLKRRPIPTLNVDETAMPFGPRATLEKARLGSNPNTHTKVEKVVGEDDRAAADSSRYLFQSGFSEHKIAQLLSVGTLGVKRRRKLVPTRWSITATDDMLGKQVLEEVKQFSKMHDCALFEADYMGNYFYVILLPIPFQYELFELYAPAFRQGRSQYSTDYESHFGRTRYAEECAGGYYTVRLAAAEYLRRVKRQAGVFVVRVITEEYKTPLGVWVTRETPRMAFRNRAIDFSTSELALRFVMDKVKKKFGIAIDEIMKRSQLLKSLQQTRLSQWT